MLQEFLNKICLSQSQKQNLFSQIISTKNIQNNVPSKQEYKQIQDEYFNLLINGNISSKSRIITIGTSAGNLIEQIFNKQMNDDVLLITTNWEHPSIDKCIVKCKNIFVLDITNNKINNKSQLIQKLKQFNKVFVYIVGTIRATGQIVDQQIFIDLIDIFVKNNIEYKLTIDSVHQCFLINRDYSIFDYIIYTGHGLLLGKDVGFLISKDGSIGYYNTFILKQYFSMLKALLPHMTNQILLQFQQEMTNYFSEVLQNSMFYRIHQKFNVNHIFTIQSRGIYLTQNMISKLYKDSIIEMEKFQDIYVFYVREQYIIFEDPKIVYQAIQRLKQILLLFKAQLVQSVYSAPVTFLKPGNTENLAEHLKNKNIIKQILAKEI